MKSPSRDQVSVATNTLRQEAIEWDGQSAAVGRIGTKVAAMSLNRVEAGLFQLIVSPYNDVVEQVSGRCNEGRAALAEVGRTLRFVADTYDEEDRSNAHRLNNLY
ncbi:hypothetical protein AWW66_09925 [Micromonospora rosaria]|uniref:ESX-1 secretion-associated protein n=1 Tax=Micromonospora rosaria TaxID=47874 RepID=A0A136PUW6_9ACTN|nr:hypothetical protein [Micromonospora rosaria]KXK62147.1 hypothetical protein AWW66_09925 [Micromonospora rosaria]